METSQNNNLTLQLSKRFLIDIEFNKLTNTIIAFDKLSNWNRTTLSIVEGENNKIVDKVFTNYLEENKDPNIKISGDYNISTNTFEKGEIKHIRYNTGFLTDNWNYINTYISFVKGKFTFNFELLSTDNDFYNSYCLVGIFYNIKKEKDNVSEKVQKTFLWDTSEPLNIPNYGDYGIDKLMIEFAFLKKQKIPQTRGWGAVIKIGISIITGIYKAYQAYQSYKRQ